MRKIIYTILCLLFLTNNISVLSSENVKKDNDAITEEDQSDSNISDIPNDYTTQLHQALQKQQELKKLKSDLETTKSEHEESVNALSDQLKRLKNDVADTQKEVCNLSNKLKKPDISKLRARRDQLNDSISMNEGILDSLRNELTSLDSQLCEYKTKKNVLVGIKDSICRRLITENRPYIEQPFSKLSTKKLKQIYDKCSPYTIDQPLKEFVDKVEKTIKNKETYDEICKILNSPYQEDVITRSIARIDAMQILSAEQEGEIGGIRRQLDSFDDGLDAFKEFINNLNDCRKDTNYSLEFFKTDEERIYKNNLAEKIKKTLLIVPYLKTKYKEFFTKFNKNPNIHSDIEKEILNQ